MGTLGLGGGSLSTPSTFGDPRRQQADEKGSSSELAIQVVQIRAHFRAAE